MKQYFTNITDLHLKCKKTMDSLNNPIEIVQLWKPCYLGNEPKREYNIEILRPDGYYDTIYFPIGDENICYNIYIELDKCYNRKITPLEKYHASF